jgi:hypothetical protein
MVGPAPSGEGPAGSFRCPRPLGGWPAPHRRHRGYSRPPGSLFARIHPGGG